MPEAIWMTGMVLVLVAVAGLLAVEPVMRRVEARRLAKRLAAARAERERAMAEFQASVDTLRAAFYDLGTALVTTVTPAMQQLGAAISAAGEAANQPRDPRLQPHGEILRR